MTALAIAPESPPAPRLIAPIGHTIALVLFFLVMAAGGAMFQQRAASHATTLPAPGRPTTLYLALIAMEWGLVLYVVRGGLRRTGTTLRDLVGGRWSRPRDAVRRGRSMPRPCSRSCRGIRSIWGCGSRCR
jgi:hypothetical protein